jgi:hypothetical protein
MPAPTPAPAPAPRPTVRHAHLSAAKQWFLGLTLTQRGTVTDVCVHRVEVGCHKMLEAEMPAPVAPDEPNEDSQDSNEPNVDSFEAKVASLAANKVAAYCEELPPIKCETPLVVAFDRQPIEFAPAGLDRFAFVPGAPAATDWPTAATPWIALDLDGDGTISSGAELFGSSTVLDGGTRAHDGFAALAALDANGDGVLDARDPMFGRLVLWSDRNGDHRSSPDELTPLASVVTAISLVSTLDPRCNARDDCEGQRATLRSRDAFGSDHVGAVVDVYIPQRR